jgi:hypothetical protein
MGLDNLPDHDDRPEGVALAFVESVSGAGTITRGRR